jgi:hypothetical protein
MLETIITARNFVQSILSKFILFEQFCISFQFIIFQMKTLFYFLLFNIRGKLASISSLPASKILSFVSVE